MRGFGSTYQRGKVWWVQFWHKGKRKRVSTGSEKEKDAVDLLKRRFVEEQKLIPLSSLQLTVQDLYESMERDYVINGHKSIRNIKQSWANHLKPVFGQIPAHLLTPEEITIYIAARQKENAQNGTINLELAALKRMYKLALRTRRLATMPYVPMLRVSNTRKGFVKDAQYEALAQETAKIGLWLRAAFEVGYTFALRKGELLGMKVSQIDLVERTITLEAGETKNDEGRRFQMTDKVYELLRQCVAGKGPKDFVFTRTCESNGRKTKTPDGRIVDFRDAWKQVTEAAGVPGLLFHDLRRSGVRNMRRIGISEKVAMKISGHKTRSVFERYNIVDQSDLEDAAQKLNQAAAERRQQEMFKQAEMFHEKAIDTRKVQ